MSTLKRRLVSNNLFLLEPYYLIFLFNFFFIKFSLYRRSPLGSVSLRSVWKKKKFSKTSCVSNRCCSWAFSGDTTSHEWVSLLVQRWMQGAARSISNCGTSSLEFVCDVDDLFSFVRVRSCWQFLHAFQMWWRLICGPRGVLMLFLSSNVAHHLEISFKNQAGSTGKLTFTLDFVLYKLRGSVKLMSEFLC